MNHIIINKFRQLVIPTILIAMTLNLTSIVDSIFVVRFIGQSGLAAVELLEPLVLLVTVFEWLFGLGGQILSLNKKAEFDEEGSNIYFTVALISTIIIGVLLVIFCSMDMNMLLTILNPPTALIKQQVIDYSIFLFIGFPIVTFLSVLTQYIRVDGQPNFSSALIIIANGINIILDYFLLVQLNMGISGASLATLIGYAIATLCALRYYFDEKRTFKFANLKMPIKSWISSFIQICKVGSPSAAMGIFDVLLVYIFNRLLIQVMGEVGLVCFSVSVDTLLIISILIVGICETLASIVPVYYSQNDYHNLNYLIRKVLLILMVTAIIFMLFILIAPEAYLMIYNLNNVATTPVIAESIKIYSLMFIPYTISTLLIFYYEAIERTAISNIISAMITLVGPLVFTFGLYPVIGNPAIWSSFALASLTAILVAYIYARILESKETEYKGLFFVKEDLIPKTENYELSNKNDKTLKEIIEHLKKLNVDQSFIDTLKNVLNNIYNSNGDNIIIDIFIIDYDEKVLVNIKDEGKINIIENIKEDVSNDILNYSELLGLNNTELTFKRL